MHALNICGVELICGKWSRSEPLSYHRSWYRSLASVVSGVGHLGLVIVSDSMSLQEFVNLSVDSGMHALRRVFQNYSECLDPMENRDVQTVDGERPRRSLPCAACKLLRRKCGEKCFLAPYFPPDKLQEFATVHKLFGASYVAKTLQDLPVEQRADAVSSMVYEATARLRDPVYGCRGTICQLQQEVSDLQSQLPVAQTDLANMRLLQATLVAAEPFSPHTSRSNYDDQQYNYLFSDVELDLLGLWEPP